MIFLNINKNNFQLQFYHNINNIDVNLNIVFHLFIHHIIHNIHRHIHIHIYNHIHNHHLFSQDTPPPTGSFTLHQPTSIAKSPIGDDSGDIQFGAYHGYQPHQQPHTAPFFNVCHLPPPSASICSQYSLNIKLESFQVDDQKTRPEFPVIACFDPTSTNKQIRKRP